MNFIGFLRPQRDISRTLPCNQTLARGFGLGVALVLASRFSSPHDGEETCVILPVLGLSMRCLTAEVRHSCLVYEGSSVTCTSWYFAMTDVPCMGRTLCENGPWLAHH